MGDGSGNSAPSHPESFHNALSNLSMVAMALNDKDFCEVIIICRNKKATLFNSFCDMFTQETILNNFNNIKMASV